MTTVYSGGAFHDEDLFPDLPEPKDADAALRCAKEWAKILNRMRKQLANIGHAALKEQNGISGAYAAIAARLFGIGAGAVTALANAVLGQAQRDQVQRAVDEANGESLVDALGDALGVTDADIASSEQSLRGQQDAWAKACAKKPACVKFRAVMVKIRRLIIKYKQMARNFDLYFQDSSSSRVLVSRGSVVDVLG